MKYKTYVVKCAKHYPGYETFMAADKYEAIKIIKGWVGCDISSEDIAKTLHEYSPESFVETLLLSSWEDNFKLKTAY